MTDCLSFYLTFLYKSVCVCDGFMSQQQTLNFPLKEAPTLQRLAGLNGIMGLFGSEQGLYQV